MPRVPQVFISSTSRDFKERGIRELVRKAATAAGFRPIMMEDFAATGHPPLETCLRHVREADLVVLLLGHWYGSVPPGQADEKSITWLECEAAKHVIPFFLEGGDSSWPREEARIMDALTEGRATPELLAEVQRRVAKMKQFREWALAKHGQPFQNVPDLRYLVFQALTEWKKNKPEFDSFVPGDPSRYLDSLWEETAFIDPEGQSGGKDAIRFPIDEIYIPLVSTGGSVPLERALSARLLVVAGDPGSGKTTFLRRVAYALCQTAHGVDPQAAKKFLGVEGEPFPVFLAVPKLESHIRKYIGKDGAPSSSDSPEWFPHFLGRESRERNRGLTADFFRRKLTSEDECWLLIDGLDETLDKFTQGEIVNLLNEAAGAFSGCRFVVTSRIQGEVPIRGFERVEVGDLEPAAIRSFLENWSRRLYSENPSRAREFHAQLERAAQGKVHIRRMTRNPAMLTALAVLQHNNRTLPEQRLDLYEHILERLATKRARNGRLPAGECLERHRELALAMQDHLEGRKTQVSTHWAAMQLAPKFGGSVEKAKAFLHAEQADSGIVVSRAEEIRFWHLTFQEYLAARELAARRPDGRIAELLGDREKKMYRPEWREVMQLLAAQFFKFGRDYSYALFESILATERKTLADDARVVGIIGTMLQDLGYNLDDSRYEAARTHVLDIFATGRHLSFRDRLAAAEALGQVGDPRLAEGNYWVTIPPCTFWMGAQKTDPAGRNFDREAESSESPVHQVVLSGYQIGRFPVTVQEFSAYIDDGGGPPGRWDEQREFPNRPVVQIDWGLARAYCEWRGCRLPTEAEWERAARGPEGKKYPWGDQEVDPARANYRTDGGPLSPTPVGLYPSGASSEGICDLIGNVWEWCSDRWGPGGGEAGQETICAARGGSWFTGSLLCRTSFRLSSRASYRSADVGFRCARGVS